jgi:hypothetical protein
MNKIFTAKRLLTILGILLAGASQFFTAQAQILTTNKIGRDFYAVNEAKQETQTSFSIDGTVTAIPGNVTCKDLNPHYLQFKIDPPRSGNYSFAGNSSVTTNFSGGQDRLTYVEYQSNTPFIAVIVKGGNQGSNVYWYNSGQTSGIGLTTPNLQDISHVSFCYVSGAVTTAATASVSGKIVDENGRGIVRTIVKIQNLNTEETRMVLTNSFGHYRFDNLPIGDLYVLTIGNKKVSLSRQTQSFVLNGDEENLNFAATAP